jgi:hypothetical protein
MRPVVLCIVFITILAGPVNFPAQNRSLIAKAQGITGDRFAYSLRTPRGAAVYSAVPVSRQMLAAIDRGLTDLFAAARRNGYSRHLAHAHYTIFIGNADRITDSSGRYSPDIAVGAAQYAGTVYDRGGYIYAAGLVMGNNPAAFVIAHHDRNLDRVSDVVRYEGEHIVLFHNDRKRYQVTADHSQGGGHPILR